MINAKTRGELRKMHMEVDSELATGQGGGLTLPTAVL